MPWLIPKYGLPINGTTSLFFDLPATADLRVRISALTDAATAAALIPIETTIGPGISITGFLLPLSEARRTRKGQYVFMNTRPVEDQLINRAIRDGYGGFPTGLHPALFCIWRWSPLWWTSMCTPPRRK